MGETDVIEMPLMGCVNTLIMASNAADQWIKHQYMWYTISICVRISVRVHTGLLPTATSEI